MKNSELKTAKIFIGLSQYGPYYFIKKVSSQLYWEEGVEGMLTQLPVSHFEGFWPSVRGVLCSKACAHMKFEAEFLKKMLFLSNLTFQWL